MEWITTRRKQDEGKDIMLSIISVLELDSGISVLSGYLCSIAIRHYGLPIRATLRDKGQSELRGLIKANQRGTK